MNYYSGDGEKSQPEASLTKVSSNNEILSGNANTTDYSEKDLSEKNGTQLASTQPSYVAGSQVEEMEASQGTVAMGSEQVESKITSQEPSHTSTKTAGTTLLSNLASQNRELGDSDISMDTQASPYTVNQESINELDEFIREHEGSTGVSKEPDSKMEKQKDVDVIMEASKGIGTNSRVESVVPTKSGVSGKSAAPSRVSFSGLSPKAGEDDDEDAIDKSEYGSMVAEMNGRTMRSEQESSQVNQAATEAKSEASHVTQAASEEVDQAIAKAKSEALREPEADDVDLDADFGGNDTAINTDAED